MTQLDEMSDEKASNNKALEYHLEQAAAAAQRMQSSACSDIIQLLEKYNHLFPPRDLTIEPKVAAYRKELLDAQYKAWLESL